MLSNYNLNVRLKHKIDRFSSQMIAALKLVLLG